MRLRHNRRILRELQQSIIGEFWSTISQGLAKTLQVCKIHGYNDIWNLAKVPICCSSYSSSNSVQMAYHKIGTIAPFGIYMKRFFSLVCMIFEALYFYAQL